MCKGHTRTTRGDLKENDKWINTKFNPNQPIEVMTYQIKDAIDFEESGSPPHSPQQTLNSVWNLIFDTELFQDEYKEWRKFPEAE